MDLPLDDWLNRLKQFKVLPEEDIRKLIKQVIPYLSEEPNVLSMSSPVTVCGDIRGQFYDLMELFNVAGHMEVTQTNYLFLGNYVNLGKQSVETFSCLLLLKAKYPSRIALLRGCFDSERVSDIYGFHAEVSLKYNQSSDVWRLFCEVLNYLPLAAVIDTKIFCVHAGLSPFATTIDDIRKISRHQDIPHEGPFPDLLWSDPDDTTGWDCGNHGAGFRFGADKVHEFNHTNGIDLICRSHQLVMEGYKYAYGEVDPCLVTVWSAPHYRQKLDNMAAVMELDSNLNKKFKTFKPSILNNLQIGSSSKEEERL